jgi:hypothetical protein
MSRVLPSGQRYLSRYGPGNDGNRPERYRWCIVYNTDSSNMFLGEQTAAERYSIWNEFQDSGGRVYGDGRQYNLGTSTYGYTSTRRLYNNTAQIGNGPCWNWNSNSANYRTPANCPGGFSYEGRTNNNNVNPNNQNGRVGVFHYDGAWMFFMEKDYGCGGNAYMKVSVNRCYYNGVTATSNGYT